MSNVIISDTSCLIALYRIDQIQLLQKLFQSIYITEIVKQEFGMELPDWIRVVEVQNKETLHRLEVSLDSGEASAIALTLIPLTKHLKMSLIFCKYFQSLHFLPFGKRLQRKGHLKLDSSFAGYCINGF